MIIFKFITGGICWVADIQSANHEESWKINLQNKPQILPIVPHSLALCCPNSKWINERLLVQPFYLWEPKDAFLHQKPFRVLRELLCFQWFLKLFYRHQWWIYNDFNWAYHEGHSVVVCMPPVPYYCNF